MSRFHRYLATAEREVAAATLILSDLLDYAAGRGPILAPMDVGDLVAEALSVAPPARRRAGRPARRVAGCRRGP